jgi:hypothetical protein
VSDISVVARKAAKSIALKIPPIARLVRHRDDLLAQIANVEVQPVAPPPIAPVLLEPPPIAPAPLEKWDNSQNGEFRILVGAMIERTVNHKYVVDVGACRKEGSNSYDLMRHFGWHGLLIEPNPYLLDGIQSEFAGLDFQLANVAAASFSGETTLHIGSDVESSSLHRGSTEASGPVRGTVTVKADFLPEILRQHDAPRDIGLLSIDAEGEGFNLLDDALTAGYRPAWVIIEVLMGLETISLDQHPASDQIKQRYRIVGRTYPNLILERIAAPD